MKQDRERIVSVSGLRPVISRSSQMRGEMLRVRAIGMGWGWWWMWDGQIEALRELWVVVGGWA